MVSGTETVRDTDGGLRERHKRRRRDAILEAVRDLLREEPDREPTKEQIAERAEVAPATVYNLVGTRAQLWQALADDFMVQLERRLGDARGGDPIARVRRLVQGLAALMVEEPVVSRRMVRGWEESGLMLRREPIGRLVDVLRSAQEAGVLLADVDALRLASSIGTACVGAIHQWAAGVIDDRRFVARALFAADLAMAAAATSAHRPRLLRALRKGPR